MEDKAPPPPLCGECHALDPRLDKDKALKTGYFLEDGKKMMLDTCLRVLNILSEELP